MNVSKVALVFIGLSVLGLGISKVFLKTSEPSDIDPTSSGEESPSNPHAPTRAGGTANFEANNTTVPSATQEPPARLQTKDLKAGSTKQVVEGSKVSFNIIVKLQDGKVVFDSYKEGRPWQGTIGDGSLINGIDRGLLGMFQGGKRALWIPPQLAYGTNGIPSQVPPNAKLYAELELISVF